MASTKILELKKEVVAEIRSHLEASESVILFQYQGLTVSDLSDLRIKLRESGSSIKVYKNTLLKRALDELNIEFEPGFLEGPNAILFGKDLLEPIKIIADFAKSHNKVDIRIGIINGKVADKSVIDEYASIPSYEGLLSMFAGGMLEHVRNLAIGLNLYAEKLEK